MSETEPRRPAIVAQAVSKTYVTHRADPGLRGAVRGLLRPQRVDNHALIDVDLTAEPGELVLLLGPNGAGKSSLIKILTGVIRPTTGEVEVAGVDPWRQRERHAHLIGAVFGQRSQLWWDLPVRQSYAILQQIYGLSDAAVRRRLDEFDQLLALSEFWETRMRHLSLGQRVRADLAGALLHSPKVIFLDEPTIGMDVVAKDQVRHFLRREVEERQCTVLLTTHDMNEVKRLGSRVVVINHGRIMSDGPMGALVAQFGGGYRIAATLTRPSDPVDVPGLSVLDRDGPRVTLVPSGDGGSLSIQEALSRVVQALTVDGIAVEEDDLEDVMRSVFTLRDRAEPAGEHA